MLNNKIVNNLELIVGPVCCGKSAELIRRVERYDIADYNVLIIKSKIDTRSKFVESRTGAKLKCVLLNQANEVYREIERISTDEGRQIDIIAFDEAQFFSDLYIVLKNLLKHGYKIIVSALDADFNGDPFGDVAKLLTISESVIKMTAICMSCKNDRAIYSQKLKQGGDRIEIGALELYHPRCLNCFIPGGLTVGLDS